MKEIIYILVVIALCMLIALQVYLFIILARLNESLRKINTLVDSINAQIPEIFENLKTITTRAKLMSNDLEKGVKQISKIMSIFVPVTSLFKMALNVFKRTKEED
ncbi:MAG: hypothetical protein ACPLN0_01720 [Candidatus Hydrothermia bacterium]